jgi:hypothetical protein
VSEEVNVEELERELRELESEKTIEIKPTAETTAVVSVTQTEEKGEINVESLEKELEKAELVAERKYLKKHGGLCHHVKLEKFKEPVIVCRDEGVHEDDEKLLVSLLYKYYPYVSKTLRVVNDIKPCERIAGWFDIVMFTDPVRLGVVHYTYRGNDERETELAYIYELDYMRNNGTLGVYLKLLIRDGKSSVTDVCVIDRPHSLVYNLLRMLRFPLILEPELEEELRKTS